MLRFAADMTALTLEIAKPSRFMGDTTLHTLEAALRKIATALEALSRFVRKPEPPTPPNKSKFLTRSALSVAKGSAEGSRTDARD
jgi:hypothetical protein